jgi:RimJ/RimL family protein N-acetyltransferase
MVEFATQYEVESFNDLRLRLVTPPDALEYFKAFHESRENNASYLDLGYLAKPHSFNENFASFMATIKSHKLDLFGLYSGKRVLGAGVYHFVPYSENGCQIVLWIRTSETGKSFGAYLLKCLTMHAFFNKKFHFAELLIDEAHSASRSMAEKVGYVYIETFETYTQGEKGSGKYCRYVCFDSTIDALAEGYGKKEIDLIDHPAYEPEFIDLILDEDINEAFKWPPPMLRD